MVNNLLLVILGGGLGSGLRFLVGNTFIVNLVGCLLIGFLAGLGVSKQWLTPSLRIFLFAGILGGFTTFSAFGLESFMLLKGSQWVLGLLNILGQVILGIILVAVGNRLGMLF